MYLYLDFMIRNKIAYGRKGDGDLWFVDTIRRRGKLVRKCVSNGATSQIAVAEFVLERIGETQRVPGSNDPARWTAWSEITVDSRSKELLIVDPVAVENKVRRYFGREGGGPRLLGSIDQVNMLRQQNNNVNGDMHEIIMTKHNEHVEVKELSGGMLDWTSSRRRWFLG
jgi:hypothetical protein